MARTLALQIQVPRLEADGVTHRRDCECARCEAGYRPSERERSAAQHAWELRREHEKAQDALARKLERRRIKRLATTLELEADEKRTALMMKEQDRVVAAMDRDPRLEALFASRRAGLSADEAVAEVERRFGPRAVGRRPS